MENQPLKIVTATKIGKPILQMHLRVIIEKQFHWVMLGHGAFEIQVTQHYCSLSSHVWFAKKVLSKSHCKKLHAKLPFDTSECL